MDKVLSVCGEAVYENVIEKSRFIAYSAHTESEEQAKAFIAGLHALHPYATHVCFGYICDKTGALMRFSDNGEPSGTAGMPILDVIKNQKLYETAVAVVRYFGGIKLGAGGLVRAYSGAAAGVLANAEKKLWQLCTETEYTTEYPYVNAALKFFAAHDCNLIRSDYTDTVTFTVAVRNDAVENFDAELTDALLGNLLIERKKEYFAPFSA